MTNYESSKQPKPLPEGVRAYGYRYQAVIATPTRTHIVGEYETPEQAHAAYQSALNAQWNG